MYSLAILGILYCCSARFLWEPQGCVERGDLYQCRLVTIPMKFKFKGSSTHAVVRWEEKGLQVIENAGHMTF